MSVEFAHHPSSLRSSNRPYANNDILTFFAFFYLYSPLLLLHKHKIQKLEVLKTYTKMQLKNTVQVGERRVERHL